MESVIKNLFIETVKNKYTKIKICRKLMEILEITDIKLLTKYITKNFEKVIENKWLTENIEVIKKTFEIKTNKYNEYVYYNIYMLLITILRNLFDVNLFIRKTVVINKVKYIYYNLDEQILTNHIKIMDKLNNIEILDIWYIYYERIKIDKVFLNLFIMKEQISTRYLIISFYNFGILYILYNT